MKRQWVVGGAILILLAIVFAVGSTPLPRKQISEKSIAITRIGFGPGYMAHVALTNITSNLITFKIIGMQTGFGVWTNYLEPFTNSIAKSIAPHGLMYERINFPGVLPPEPWRLRLVVTEELKGSERLPPAISFAAKSFVLKLRGAPVWLPPVRSMRFYGHRTEIMISDELSWPRLR